MLAKLNDQASSIMGSGDDSLKPSVAVATVNLDFGNQTRSFHLFDTSLCRKVCYEVVSGQVYPILPFIRDVHTVVDIGANVGAATIYFAQHYPKARIFAFEPATTTYELLVKNTKDLNLVSIFNLGLYDQDMEAPLFIGQDDSVTNSIAASCENTGNYCQISLRDAKSVFQEQKIESIDILKLDTEGSELPILRSISDWIPKIGILYLEFHATEDRIEIDRLLAQTHVLFCGRIQSPHRGELCYVLNDQIPENVDSWRIRL